MSKSIQHNSARRKNNFAQAMVEYVLLVSLVMLILVGVGGLFLGGLGDFFLNIVKIVSLPIP